MSAGWRHLWDESFQSPEEVTEFEAERERVQDLIEKVVNSTELEYEIGWNPDEDGRVNLEGGIVVLKFPNVIGYSYQGFPYYLPADEKGKAKRIKNKTVKIIPEQINRIAPTPIYNMGRVEVVVKSFEILK